MAVALLCASAIGVTSAQRPGDGNGATPAPLPATAARVRTHAYAGAVDPTLRLKIEPGLLKQLVDGNDEQSHIIAAAAQPGGKPGS